MDTCTYPYGVRHDESDGINWAELYPRLHAFARNLVYKYRVPDWYGQEEDVAEDVTQEAARRLIERLRKRLEERPLPLTRLNR